MRQRSKLALDLAKKLGENDNIESQTRPLRNTLDTDDDADVTMESMSNLKYAKDELSNLRILYDRGLKERENVRFLSQRAQNLTTEESGNYIYKV